MRPVVHLQYSQGFEAQFVTIYLRLLVNIPPYLHVAHLENGDDDDGGLFYCGRAYHRTAPSQQDDYCFEVAQVSRY